MLRERINNQLIIISGPSGTGKNTIIFSLIKKGFPLEHSISTTTRLPRMNEISGKNYYFCDETEFLKKIQENSFLEYACVLNTYYGTTKQEITRIQSKGNIPILDIDIQGHNQIKKEVPTAISIFIMPPSLRELKNRLVQRKTENTEEIQKRLKLAQEEMRQTQNYDYIVINEKLEKAIKEVEGIIDKCITN